MVQGLYFEELDVGATYKTERVTVTEEAIIRFAREWDPQPFHVDRSAAGESIFGGLVASGLNTLLLSYRLYYDHGLLNGTAIAGLGIDEARFLKPLRPDDTIQVTITIVETRASKKPGRGAARIRIETENQRGETILRYYINPLVACRPVNSDCGSV